MTYTYFTHMTALDAKIFLKIYVYMYIFNFSKQNLKLIYILNKLYMCFLLTGFFYAHSMHFRHYLFLHILQHTLYK